LQDDLVNGEEVARCPSCSLLIKVIYDPEDFAETENDGDEGINSVTELPAEIVA